MQGILGSSLQGKNGHVPTADLANVEFVLLYFSAHWCGPCRGFTPKLDQFYQEVNADQHRLEIVFVSFDRDENAYRGYYEEMPWLSIPYTNAALREQLGKVFSVTGIPKLVLLSKDGQVAVDNCRMDVEGLGPRALERWRTQL